ncbi:penicillin-binding protein activator LpoB [Thalassoglobus polymorphus]|uniref:Penicillin-binding protein activator LpoB n=1 Tax=Thalassoglobus polymorphus TaxID=2527994 RepID=A0A517QHS3_9PLAN|nr:penicillin-binding protein activator LpoB [Thalassoglobus polymorphus]QDT31181.1 hypothetical protein Mal48_04130 [Thalassoglobus polymorphus]
MDRRNFLSTSSIVLFTSAFGCRGTQKATVLDPTDADAIASHEAGAETWKPLIDEAVGRLTGRQIQEIQQASAVGMPSGKKRICFIGVENRSAEEIGDFKEQIYEHIDTLLSNSELFGSISRRYVEAGLRDARLRPDDLFMPKHQQLFTQTMEKMNQPFDYMLFAKITSGTTRDNKKYQRDYLLTLEMVDINTGEFTKESATLRKMYKKSLM